MLFAFTPTPAQLWIAAVLALAALAYYLVSRWWTNRTAAQELEAIPEPPPLSRLDTAIIDAAFLVRHEWAGPLVGAVALRGHIIATETGEVQAAQLAALNSLLPTLIKPRPSPAVAAFRRGEFKTSAEMIDGLYAKSPAPAGYPLTKALIVNELPEPCEDFALGCHCKRCYRTKLDMAAVPGEHEDGGLDES